MSARSMIGPPPGQPVLRVEHVKHVFRKAVPKNGTLIVTEQPALIDVNLKVMAGELVILKGPSGCGKTTLLTLIGGLRRLQGDGHIEIWDGHKGEYLALHRMKEPDLVELRKSIGFIFQKHNLLTSLTAMQNVGMAQKLLPPSADPFREARALLAYLDLDKQLYSTPRQISGGQSQRVAIARALINHPRLVLADEPTAALDKDSSDWVIELLRQLGAEHELPGTFHPRRQEFLREFTQQKGCTSLIVTHDDRIVDLADRIVEMKEGRIAKNVIVAERMFLYNGLRCSAGLAAFLPEELIDLADAMSVGVRPDAPVPGDWPDAVGKLTKVAAEEVVIREGDNVGAEDAFYLIRSGQLAVLVRDRDGAVKRVAMLQAGSVVGERAVVKALIDDQVPRNASVVATEPTVLYTCTLGQLRSLGEGWEKKQARQQEQNRIGPSVRRFIKLMEEVYGSGGMPPPITGATPG